MQRPFPAASGDEEAPDPVFRATSILDPSYAAWTTGLSVEECDALGRIGKVMHVERGRSLYEKGDPYAHLFVILKGVVKTFRISSHGETIILALLFEQDIAGLGEEGRYVNSAEAVEDATVLRLPIRELAALLREDAHLEMLLLCKACNEIRASQQHALLLSRHSARTKVAMFLRLAAERQLAGPSTIHLSMGRADIASYLGLSIEAVSRAFRGLEREGVLAFHGPREVAVADPELFHAIVADAD